MKNFKKVLALVLVVATLLSFATVASAATSASYTDADKVTRTAAVDVLSYIGVLNGYTDKTFRPQGEITRAEAAKIIAMFDNGSSAINGLYASANPFTDCVGHWAESSIAYCYKMGIIDGVGNLKFDPEANVTGVQFLKMALIVLGFDAQKEGLTGASWAVNTLALAKKAGLLSQLGNSYDYAANLVREDAAQIMLNALNAYVVEYGYVFKPAGLQNNETKYITTAGAVSTDTKLAANWGITTAPYTDAFERPGTVYKCNDETIATYLLTPEVTYTTKISECKLLEDLGIAKSNLTDDIVIDQFENGSVAANNKTLKHDSKNVCYATALSHTGQGTLTEVYDVSNWGLAGSETYRVVHIQTWLAKVDEVIPTTYNRLGHYQTGTPNLKLSVYDVVDGDALSWTTAKEGFSVNDMVLVTRSWKQGEAGVQSVVLANAEVAQLTGYDRTNDADPKTVNVANADKAEAVKFVLGYNVVGANNITYYENLEKNYTFYYDAYGNVIGVAGVAAAASQYAVIDSAYYAIASGAGYATGSMVTLDAKAADVKIAAAQSINPPTNKAYSDFSEYVITEMRGGHSVDGNEWAYDMLYTYTVDAYGEYHFTYANGIHYYTTDSYKTVATINEGDKNVYINAGGADVELATKALNSATQILIHENDGSYTAATVATVGTIQAGGIHMIDANADGYAEVVYLFDGIVRKGDVLKGYVVDWSVYQTKVVNGTKYYVYNVYFDGVATPVYFKSVQTEKTDGLYTFKFALSEDKVVWADADAATNVANGTLAKVSADKDGMLLNNEYAQKNFAADVKVYYVDTIVEAGTAHATVIASSIDELHVGDELTVVYNAAGYVTAIYVVGCAH